MPDHLSSGFLLLFTLVVLTFPNLSKQTCYWPTGNATYDRDAYEHLPCSNDTTSPLSTICCALNRTNPSGGDKLFGRTNDECLPNGVCRNRVLDRGVMQVSYWRETCTSENWKVGGLCLDICSDDWSSGNGTTGAVMTPCDGTEKSLRWCCGTSTDCCKDESKVKILPFEFGGAIPNTASATPLSLPRPTSTLTTSDPSETDGSGKGDGKESSLSSAAKAGIGVGAGVGAILLVGLGYFAARRRTAYKGQMAGLGHAHGYSQWPSSPPPPIQKDAYYVQELQSATRYEFSTEPPQSTRLNGQERSTTPKYEMAS